MSWVRAIVGGGFLPIFFASVGLAADLSITRTRDLPCFEPDERLEYRPIANCQADAKTPWSELQTYRFNDLGLREKQISTFPEPGMIRIVIMGPTLDGVGLKDDQLPARQIESKFRELGVNHLEVVNATIPGYSAGRYAMSIEKLSPLLRPNYVVYYQTAENFAYDFVEEKKIVHDEYGNREKMLGAGSKPNTKDQSFYDDVGEMFFRIKLFWKFYFEADNNDQEQKLFLGSTWSAFEEISSRFGTDVRFIVAWAPRNANNADVINPLGNGFGFLTQLISPSVMIPGPRLTKSLRREGINYITVSKGFSTPVKSGLAPAKNPTAMTAKGAEIWAEDIVMGLRQQLALVDDQSLNQDALKEIHSRRADQLKKRAQKQIDRRAEQSTNVAAKRKIRNRKVINNPAPTNEQPKAK